jgi:hypothetical protein
MVVLMAEVDLPEQMLQLLSAAMHVANEDESALLLRQVLLVHIANLDHALEVRAHVAAVAHLRRVVHVFQLLLVLRVPRTDVDPPADEEENNDGEAEDRVALDAPRKLVDAVLPLAGDQSVVLFAVETVFLVRHVEIISVGYEVDEGRVFGRVVAVVRHRCEISGPRVGRRGWRLWPC